MRPMCPGLWTHRTRRTYVFRFHYHYRKTVIFCRVPTIFCRVPIYGTEEAIYGTEEATYGAEEATYGAEECFSNCLHCSKMVSSSSHFSDLSIRMRVSRKLGIPLKTGVAAR